MPENEARRLKEWYPSAAPAAEDVESWYAPADAAPGRNGPGAGKDEKKRRRTKIVSLSVCAVILLCAAGLAIWKLAARGKAPGASGEAPAVFAPYEDTGEFDTFTDYFEVYYSSTSDIGLERAPTGTGVTLTLYPEARHELSLQEIYDGVSPAVVGVSAYREGQLFSWGSGVIFTADGYIVTNTHILSGCDYAVAALPDGRTMEARLVGADNASDIAVLKVEGQGLPVARFGDSDSLHVGDLAVAIGNPIGQQYAGTMTDGIISAIDRNVKNNGHTMTLLQTNAALNEGSSGGPLLNAGGQVIGITNMKLMSAYFVTVEGIGFAIPSSVVKEIADQLIENGYVPGEPGIGIIAASVSTEAMRLYGLPEGVYVAEVKDGSDAKQRGLQVGDIITEVNGTPVRSVSEVNAIKDDFDVGDVLTLTIYRGGETFPMEIELVDNAEIG